MTAWRIFLNYSYFYQNFQPDILIEHILIKKSVYPELKLSKATVLCGVYSTSAVKELTAFKKLNVQTFKLNIH